MPVRTRIALVASLILALTACGWTQYGGNAGRSGQAPFERALTTANAGQAKIVWTGYGDTGEVAISGGVVYGGNGLINIWPVAAGARCSGQPLVCLPTGYAFDRGQGGSSDPVVDGDTLMTASVHNGHWTLTAYDVHAPCTTDGSPSCAPIWTGTAGPAPSEAHASSLTVAGGRVFLTGDGIPVTAFDAGGVRNCTGTPATCAPLFTAAGGTPTQVPAVDGDRLLVPVADGIEVFDATGDDGCTATVCSPRFRLVVAGPGEVSAAGGQAFTASGKRLFAFDDTGTTNCAGAPLACGPLWQGTLAAPTSGDAPIITATRVFANSVGINGFTMIGGLEAFDRSATTGCSGTPLTCARLFMTSPGTTYPRAHASASAGLLVVASSSIPLGTISAPTGYQVSFYDLDGVVGCRSRRCAPVATLDLGEGDAFGLVGHPAIANGVVVVPRYFESPLVIGLP